MKRYQPSNPRFHFGIIAFALSALTLAASVVVPAHVQPIGHVDATLAQRTLPATPIAISPARIEVIGFRGTKVAASPRGMSAKTKPGG